ncbi:MAG: hypothetical protein PWP64_1660 [Candidatus Cloacimonadota bacterium]|nr:hypothetical protein [Candidatus Cloacimonadota bacterium]
MHTDHNYNPDVLSCIANLSSDEVFTPPELVNQMLDLLPPNLFNDKHTTFLDPACKSGVFLREIAKRLDKGLESQIPDIQKRINHIFTKQLFGLAITELTALLSRRSLYCSKNANGKYSVCTKFKTDSGNIIYNRIEHIWENGRCKFCGANEQSYDRGAELESHAYSFIHTEIPEELFKMKFDVIIGNPPYQLSDGGGSNEISAKPIYNHFVKQAKKMNPMHIVMIIPARWFAGGKGLDGFRRDMLSDKRIRTLHDFPKSRECFPGVDIAGGVCYFHWDRDYIGECKLVTRIGETSLSDVRSLNEFDILIRDSVGVGIIHKVLKMKEKLFSEVVLSRNSFGFSTSARGSKNYSAGSVKLISSQGQGFVGKNEVLKNIELVEKYKVSIGTLNPDRAGVNNASDGKMNVTTKVRVLGPNEIVTETYIIVGYFDTADEANNCAQYIRTMFARYLISLTLSSMHIVKDNFRFVPVQDFNIEWDDKMLFDKYGLDQEEIEHIESMIRPMELPDA